MNTQQKLHYPSNKVRLVNSAMMPTPGKYTYVALTESDFGHEVREAHMKEKLVSYIGYEQTAKHVEKILGVPVTINRSQTTMEDGDLLLIVKLKYRVPDPTKKGEPVPEEWEYGVAHYSAK